MIFNLSLFCIICNYLPLKKCVALYWINLYTLHPKVLCAKFGSNIGPLVLEKVILVCFVRMGFIVQLENFSLIWRRHHYWWRAANSYARHSWPLSSEGSLACHTYCDTGHPFIMVISEDPWHTPIAERSAVELSILFLRLRSVAAGIRTPKLRLAGPTL